ncbi:MAG: hypothetical protein OSA48_02790 [Akkermansiaceae bacterium]|nr:hypothetical protein [Akkermansiaceae bacterium]
MSSYVRELDSVAALCRSEGQLGHAVVQGLDLRKLGVDWDEVECEGAIFLGCGFPDGVEIADLLAKGAMVFPGFSDLPFDPYRPRLYSRAELMEGWTPLVDQSVDKKIYDYFVGAGKDRPSVIDALAQRLHDHAIEDAMHDLLEGRTDRSGRKKVVGLMGGHGTPRTDPYYWKVARMAQQLTRDGYFVATGGGPGIMEAANLGAYLADVSNKEMESALLILGRSEVYTDPGYMEAAQEVLDMYPHGQASLAVPTWFYGHEPGNLFSVHIAKYFSNSLREDGLLTIAAHGIVFAPGSAGTTQEVFQDATQNHYQTFGVVSPMAFLGKEHFGEKTGVFDCLSRQAAGKAYADSLLLTNSGEKVIEFLKAHPPVG